MPGCRHQSRPESSARWPLWELTMSRVPEGRPIRRPIGPWTPPKVGEPSAAVADFQCPNLARTGAGTPLVERRANRAAAGGMPVGPAGGTLRARFPHCGDNGVVGVEPSIHAAGESVCASCGGRFRCGVDAPSCWCSRLTLSAEVRSRLASTYTGCLCPDCLERESQAGSPPASS